MATRIALCLVLGLAATAAAQFTEWSTPAGLGPPVDTTDPEGAPFLSKNGLTLYFSGIGPDGSSDVFVSQRASLGDPWGPPQHIRGINAASADNNPALSLDEHWLYISSNRAGGFGALDLWVSRRHSRRDELGWSEPVNLGSTVNTASIEIAPTFFEDEASGVITMYFASDRAGLGSFDIYSSTQLPDGTFAPAVLVADLSSSASDQGPHVRRDGLEIFIASNRPGTLGNTDLMVSTRATTSEPWSPPVFLGAAINTPFADQAPALSYDGTALFYVSTGNLPGATGPCSGELGPCVSDIFVVTRSRRKGPNH